MLHFKILNVYFTFQKFYFRFWVCLVYIILYLTFSNHLLMFLDKLKLKTIYFHSVLGNFSIWNPADWTLLNFNSLAYLFPWVLRHSLSFSLPSCLRLSPFPSSLTHYLSEFIFIPWDHHLPGLVMATLKAKQKPSKPLWSFLDLTGWASWLTTHKFWTAHLWLACLDVFVTSLLHPRHCSSLVTSTLLCSCRRVQEESHRAF